MWFRFSRPDYFYLGRYTLLAAGDASPFNRGWSQGFGFFILHCRWNKGRAESEGIHYAAQQVSDITINGTRWPIGKTVLSYEDVIAFAGERTGASVTFHKADQDPRDGTMWPGCAPVRIKDGTIFNAVMTGSA